MRYPVVLHTDDGTRYGVTVPDLPGCFSAGDTFDDALDAVREAIDLHLEGLTEDGGDIPAPQPIAQHQKAPDYVGGVWALVDVDVSRYEGKAEKINITLPRRLLVRIDEYAKAHGASRSGFLAEAARLQSQDPAFAAAWAAQADEFAALDALLKDMRPGDMPIVPVRLTQHEGEKLVSRSQAKRLTMRFERFQSVVLDFTGVAEIGQAFADEVFRVFQNAHPETALIPVNMAPDVAGMVSRAKAGLKK